MKILVNKPCLDPSSVLPKAKLLPLIDEDGGDVSLTFDGIEEGTSVGGRAGDPLDVVAVGTAEESGLRDGVVDNDVGWNVTFSEGVGGRVEAGATVGTIDTPDGGNALGTVAVGNAVEPGPSDGANVTVGKDVEIGRAHV